MTIMSGMNKFSMKQKRQQRRRSHVAKDLRTPKYGQRRVEGKKHIHVDVKDLTHRELVELINEKEINDVQL